MFDLFVGYTGLAISFVMFAFIILVIFIRANNISWKSKFVTIPLVLLYSIVLYYTPGQFMGYASGDVEDVGQVIVLHYFVVEDDAIYFMVLDYNKENISMLLPRPVDATKGRSPRLYKIKYNSEIHKALLKAWAQQKKSKGRLGILADFNKLHGIAMLNPGEKAFEMFDPAKVLRKTEEQ